MKLLFNLLDIKYPRPCTCRMPWAGMKKGAGYYYLPKFT